MTGISTPPTHQSSRDLAPPLLRLAQGRLSFGSCLLRSAHPSHQKSSTFNEVPEKAPFPSQGSQIYSHCTFTTCTSQNSFPDSYPRLPVFMKKRIMIYAQSLLFYAMTGNISLLPDSAIRAIINLLVDACKYMGTSDALPQPHNQASTLTGLTHIQGPICFQQRL